MMKSEEARDASLTLNMFKLRKGPTEPEVFSRNFEKKHANQHVLEKDKLVGGTGFATERF